VDAWYARNMYAEGSKAYEFHVKTDGHPSKVGFKDIVQRWNAEKFDAGALTAAFKRAGAKYIVPVGVHHDNFDCWKSKHHSWNSVNYGPKRDIVGLWKTAAQQHGLRFGVSEHVERSYSWFNTNKGSDKRGPLAGVPYDGADPKYRDFYFEPHDDTNAAYPKNPPRWWMQRWLDRVNDLVDSYQPDLLYTDGGLPFGDYGLRMLSGFYNRNLAWHKGKLEAVYNIKNFLISGRTDHGEFQDGAVVEDLERGVLKGIKPEPWQTDTCIGGWYYIVGHRYKTPGTVIHMLADSVSKNGNLLLNIPLKPEGDLDPEAAAILDSIAKWMSMNAEAIHGTRPWDRFGEGPSQVAEGQFAEDKTKYTPRDIRFTRKGDVIYAICLGVPEKELVIGSLANLRASKVSILGTQGVAVWQRDSRGLIVQVPAGSPIEHAMVVKITA
jgi:alpha-L-fucosidase